MRGSDSQNVAPNPGALVTPTCPPWRSMMVRVMYNPSPRPTPEPLCTEIFDTRKKRSQRSSCASAGIPRPASRTRTQAMRPSVSSETRTAELFRRIFERIRQVVRNRLANPIGVPLNNHTVFFRLASRVISRPGCSRRCSSTASLTTATRSQGTMRNSRFPVFMRETSNRSLTNRSCLAIWRLIWAMSACNLATRSGWSAPSASLSGETSHFCSQRSAICALSLALVSGVRSSWLAMPRNSSIRRLLSSKRQDHRARLFALAQETLLFHQAPDQPRRRHR